MMDKVTQAMQSLDAAKTHLAQLKSSAGADNKDDSMNVSDDDIVKDVSGATAQNIKEGIHNLHQSLQELKSSADQLEADEQHALKRPRIAKESEEATATPNTEATAFR